MLFSIPSPGPGCTRNLDTADFVFYSLPHGNDGCVQVQQKTHCDSKDSRAGRGAHAISAQPRKTRQAVINRVKTQHIFDILSLHGGDVQRGAYR